jgi:hypothetical protein
MSSDQHRQYSSLSDPIGVQRSSSTDHKRRSKVFFAYDDVFLCASEYSVASRAKDFWLCAVVRIFFDESQDFQDKLGGECLAHVMLYLKYPKTS